MYCRKSKSCLRLYRNGRLLLLLPFCRSTRLLLFCLSTQGPLKRRPSRLGRKVDSTLSFGCRAAVAKCLPRSRLIHSRRPLRPTRSASRPVSARGQRPAHRRRRPHVAADLAGTPEVVRVNVATIARCSAGAAFRSARVHPAEQEQHGKVHLKRHGSLCRSPA